MSRVLQRTIQERRARVNVESMVSFDGISQHASAGVNPNVLNAVDFNKPLSISTFFQINNFNEPYAALAGQGRKITGVESNRGWRILIQNTGQLYFEFVSSNHPSNAVYKNFRSVPIIASGRLYHLVVNYDGATLKFYLNSNPVSHTTTTQGSLTQSVQIDNWPIWIARDEDRYGIQRYVNIYESHLSFFTRVLTLTEIKGIHRTGGLLPASAHAACVAHYPCTERNGKVLNDIVGDYNYAKPLINIYTNYGNNTGNAGAGDWVKSNGGSLNTLATYVTVGNSATSSKRIYTPSNGLTHYNYSASIRTARATGIFEIFQNGALVAASSELGNITNGNLTTNVNFNFVVGGAFEIRYRQTGQGSGSSSDLFNDRIQNTENLSAYHATLQNYTDAEVGIPDQSTNTAWRDFYTKQPITSL